MELQKLQARLITLQKEAIPGMEELELADDEFGPFCEFLSRFEQTQSGVEMVFDDGKNMTISQAIDVLEPFVKSAPSSLVYRMYEGEVLPLKKVYEDIPVVVLECEFPHQPD